MNEDQLQIDKIVTRWRLILGKHATRALGNLVEPSDNEDASSNVHSQFTQEISHSHEVNVNQDQNEFSKPPLFSETYNTTVVIEKAREYDELLNFLYDRPQHDLDSNIKFSPNYQIVEEIWKMKQKTGTSNTGHLLTVSSWVNKVQEFFPKEAAEFMTKDAINTYHMTELLTNPEILETVEANLDIVKVLLSFKDYLSDETLAIAKNLIQRVVEDIESKFRSTIQNAIIGHKNRFRPSSVKVAKNFDFKKTIIKNLRYWDTTTKRLSIEKTFFNSRLKIQHPWHIILLVDESGSMIDSVIYSAIMAGIFTSIRSLRTSLIVFDTEVVDLSDVAHDPVETLLSCQLGGGTNIGKAVAYAASLITNTQKTILILISDFFEGTKPNLLYAQLKALKESNVILLGLTALDPDANPEYNSEIVGKCVDIGMTILAVTPIQLANEIAKIIHT